MKIKILALFLFLGLFVNSYAQAPDRRISDDDGNVLNVNSDGSIPVQITGSKFYVNSTSGNVGIGNTNPVGLLHVSHAGSYARPALFIASTGNIGLGSTSPAVDKLQIFNSSQNGISIVGNADLPRITLSDGTATILMQAGDSGGDIYTTTADPLRFAANSNVDQLNLNRPHMMIDTNGNIGIGTTNPTSKLVINATTPTVAISGAAGQYRKLRFDTTDSQRWIVSAESTAETGSNAGSNFAISSYTDTGTFIATPLWITRSTSAVGINKASPTTAFHVGGSVTIDSNLTVVVGGSLNAATCFKAGGVIGYCSSAVGATGTCTCN